MMICKYALVAGDLKPANLLVTEHNEIKICDFGISKDLNNYTETTYVGFGTTPYVF